MAGKGLAKGLHRVGAGLAKGFLVPSNFEIPETPYLQRKEGCLPPLPPPPLEKMEDFERERERDRPR